MLLGPAITLTTCGIPMLLQGEEMLTTNQFGANIPINLSYTNTYSDIVSYYTDLIQLRRNLNGRSAGSTGLNTSTIWEDSSNHLIAYRRYNTGNVGGQGRIVICNFANTNWPAYNVGGFPHTQTSGTRNCNSDWTKYSSDYGNYGSASTTVGVGSATATISIAPYSVLILSQNIPGAPPTPRTSRSSASPPTRSALVGMSPAAPRVTSSSVMAPRSPPSAQMRIGTDCH